jgi:ATP-dependent DNA ligase
LLDANGHSDFGVLQAELGAKRSDKTVFYAFDLL